VTSAIVKPLANTFGTINIQQFPHNNIPDCYPGILSNNVVYCVLSTAWNYHVSIGLLLKQTQEANFETEPSVRLIKGVRLTESRLK